MHYKGGGDTYKCTRAKTPDSQCGRRHDVCVALALCWAAEGGRGGGPGGGGMRAGGVDAGEGGSVRG